jgi:hypothetical protein
MRFRDSRIFFIEYLWVAFRLAREKLEAGLNTTRHITHMYSAARSNLGGFFMQTILDFGDADGPRALSRGHGFGGPHAVVPRSRHRFPIRANQRREIQ